MKYDCADSQSRPFSGIKYPCRGKYIDYHEVKVRVRRTIKELSSAFQQERSLVEPYQAEVVSQGIKDIYEGPYQIWYEHFSQPLAQKGEISFYALVFSIGGEKQQP